jgi:four helix bundle protein
MTWTAGGGWKRETRPRLSRTNVFSKVTEGGNLQEGLYWTAVAEYRHYLSVARGSLAEVETQLIIAVRLNYLSNACIEDIMAIRGEVERMITAILKRLT